ncbi:MAG: hypothetical protein AB1430_11160 [Pseudomonadota bacterium]
MHQVSIRQRISQGDVSLVLAADEQHRSFVGFNTGDDADSPVLFVQVDRVTLQELELGVVDVYTVITERCAGMVFEATARQAATMPLATAA